MSATEWYNLKCELDRLITAYGIESVRELLELIARIKE